MNPDLSFGQLLRASPRHFTGVWLLVGGLFIAAVICASVSPVPEIAAGMMTQDKLVHLAVYTILMGWFAQIYRHDLTRLLMAAALIGMGVGIEFWQGTTPTRQFDPFDMVANSGGVLLAWAVSYTSFGRLLERLDEWIAGGTAVAESTPGSSQEADRP